MEHVSKSKNASLAHFWITNKVIRASSQEVPKTPTKITRDGLVLDNLQTMCAKNINTKSFVANKINIIAKAPVRNSYSSFSQAELISNILAKLIHFTLKTLVDWLFLLLNTLEKCPMRPPLLHFFVLCWETCNLKQMSLSSTFQHFLTFSLLLGCLWWVV